MNILEKNILKTFGFFNILKRPLTEQELWHNLWKIKIDFSELRKNLKNLQKENKINQIDGYYFLKGQKDLVKEKKQRELESAKLWQIAKKNIKKFQTIPYIKMVAVVGSLSQNNASQKSDIDLVIFGQKNHLRLVRDLVILTLQTSGQLTRQTTKKGHIGPDFFTTLEKANFQYLTRKFSGFRQMYWVYFFRYLTPVLERGKIYKKFQAKNIWIFKFLPNLKWEPKNMKIKTKKSEVKNFLNSLFDNQIGEFLEKQLAQSQKQRLANLKNKQGKSTVINTDKHIMLFDDKGKKWQKYEKRFEKFLTKNKLI